MARLGGKVALVMAGGSDGPPAAGDSLAIGNGRAIAIECAREGAQVMVADRVAEFAEETSREIRNAGKSAEATVCDVLDDDQCRRAVAQTVAAFGRLDIRVNNLLPGFVDSPMLRKAAGNMVPDFSAMVPIGRVGSAWDIARLRCSCSAKTPPTFRAWSSGWMAAHR